MLPCLCIRAHAIIECFIDWFFIDVRLFFLFCPQATDSFMTFEGHQIQGAPKILEKVQVSVRWNIKLANILLLYITSIHRV